MLREKEELLLNSCSKVFRILRHAFSVTKKKNLIPCRRMSNIVFEAELRSVDSGVQRSRSAEIRAGYTRTRFIIFMPYFKSIIMPRHNNVMAVNDSSRRFFD